MQQKHAQREYRADALLLILLTLVAALSRFLPRTTFFTDVVGNNEKGILLRYLPALVPTLSVFIAAGFFLYFLATVKRRHAQDFVISLLMIACSLAAACCFWHWALQPAAADFVYDADAFLVAVYASADAPQTSGVFFDPQFFGLMFSYIYLIATMLYFPVKQELGEWEAA